MEFVFDTSKKGLETVMKDYEAICMSFIWETGEEGVTTSKAWLNVNKVLMEEEKTISRASIIKYLNNMFEKGILRYISKPGKGGYHRVYYPVYDEAEFKEHIARQIIENLMTEFPEETDTALLKIKNEGTGKAEARGQPGPQT